jgi:hypothetical protein
MHISPLTAPGVPVALLTVPLALFVVLAETTIGTVFTVLVLQTRGDLTRGFLKFMALAELGLAVLALLAALGAPPASYVRLLPIDGAAAGLLPGLLALVVVALAAAAWATWTGRSGLLTWLPPALTCGALLAAVALTFVTMGGSVVDGLAIAGLAIVSSMVLGAATTGMLLGHWYLVTPALTNRPLLRAIAILLVALVVQPLLFLPGLLGLARSPASFSTILTQNPTLAVLWALGAVGLPLLAAGLAFPTCRMRSFMSTTGLLYLAMIALLPGQLLGHLLLFVTAA